MKVALDRCDRSGPDRGCHSEDLVPVFLDLPKIDGASDQAIEGPVVSAAIDDIEPALGQIAEARREPEPQQVAEPEHVLGRATGIGIVLPDGQGTLMMEQSVQNVGGLATALLKRVEEQQPNLRCSSLPMTSAATERNSKVISSDPPITSRVIVM